MKRLLVLCFLTATAFADEVAVKKYRNFTPKQIAAMPDKLRSDQVPMMYIFAAQTGMAKGSGTLFAMYLNVLMYPGVHSYEAAVKEFQRDLGDEATGVLTVWQISNLEKRAQMQKLANVILPNQFFGSITDTYASVRGTFVILDDKIAYPVNDAHVSCDKSDGYCKVEQIYIDFPDDDSWSQNYHVMQFDPEYYRITSWTKNTIDAVPDGSSTACRATTMNLNFSTKEFYQITRNTGRDCKALGQTVPKLERPRISQIVDGEKIIAREFADVQKRAFAVLASNFRVKMEKLIAEEEKESKE